MSEDMMAAYLTNMVARHGRLGMLAVADFLQGLPSNATLCTGEDDTWLPADVLGQWARHVADGAAADEIERLRADLAISRHDAAGYLQALRTLTPKWL